MYVCVHMRIRTYKTIRFHNTVCIAIRIHNTESSQSISLSLPHTLSISLLRVDIPRFADHVVHICIFVSVCVHAHVRIFLHLYMCMYIHAYTRMHINTQTNTSICRNDNTMICMHTHVMLHMPIRIRNTESSQSISLSHTHSLSLSSE